MTRETALKLVKFYEKAVRDADETDPTITEIASRFPKHGSAQKAMRWLGFMQGVCWVLDIFNLTEIKEHSRVAVARERRRK